MRFACSIHGEQLGVLISPDLSTSLETVGIEVVDIVYEYDGEVALSCHVSIEFAQSRNVKSGSVELPDESEEWVDELVACCEKCFESHHGGVFECFRWVPGSEE